MHRKFIFIPFFLISISVTSQVNVAVNKPVSVDSELSSQPDWKAVDGLNYSNSNRWVSNAAGYPHWIIIDLQQPYIVNQVNFYTGEYGDNHPVYEYKLQSWSGSAWTDFVSRTNNNTPVVKETFSPVLTSKVRLYASSGEGSSLMLYEIEIFADYNLAPTIDPVQNPDPVYTDEPTQSIILSGISDGDTNKVQTLNITGTSSDHEVVTDPVIIYSSGDSTAELQWTPAGSEGTSTITVTVEDSGDNEYGGNNKQTNSFQVSVRDPDKNYAPTIDGLPEMYAFSNGDDYQIRLTGITDGDPNKDQELEIMASSTANAILENLKISCTSSDSTGILKFKTSSREGIDTVLITLKDNGDHINGGTDSTRISLIVKVVKQTDAVRIITDITRQHQIIEGLGGFGMEKVEWSRGPYYSDAYINDILNDLGISILRIPVSATGFEPFNDNEDPYSMDVDQYRENIYNGDNGKFFNFLKDLIKTGNPKIVASIWSPPAWMKSNNNVQEGGHLLTQYYQEFAEYVVAFIKMLKLETGIDLYAISLQNEPTFYEPYESCQYTPQTYCSLIKVVGERFKLEGITTKLFYPEEVFVRESDIAGWMETLNNDTSARKYVDIMALHGYDYNGSSAGEYGGELWEKYYTDYANFPGYPKQFWMSETSGESNNMQGALDMITGLSYGITYGKLNAWIYWTISGEAFNPYAIDQVYNLMLNGVKLRKYYVSKNYYRYVRPGAKSVECKSSDEDVLVNAFWHEENNTLTYAIINRSTANKIINFSSYNMPTDIRLYRTSENEDCEEIPVPPGSEVFMLPAKSVSTFVLNGGSYQNHPPTLDFLQDTVFVGSPDSIVLRLTGISDGDPDKDQPLEIEVMSSNNEILSEYRLEYSTGADSGRIILSPVPGKSGYSMISVTLSESDPDNLNEFLSTTSATFKLWLINYINNPPSFYDIDTAYINLSEGQQSIKIYGVTDGNDEVQEMLDFGYWAVHDRYFDIDSLIYVQGDTIAELLVTPKRKGAAIVKVMVTDDGETIFGENYFEDSFFIKVIDMATSDNDNLSSGISIVPNPASDEIRILNVGQFDTFQVLSLTGNLIKNGFIIGPEITISTSDYPESQYYIMLLNNKSVVIKGFIITH